MNFNRVKLGNFIFRFFQSIVCIIATIIILALCYDKPYKFITVLPFSYMVINIFYKHRLHKNNDNYTGGFIYKISLMVIFIRFVITPLFIALTGKFYSANAYTSTNSINLAIMLMTYELICIYITLYIARSYYSKKYKNTVSNRVEIPNHKFILILFAMLGSLVVLLVEPNLIIPQDFLVLSNDYQKIQLDMDYDGLYSSLATLVKPVIFIIIFSCIKRQYDLKNRRVYIWLSFFVVILFMGMYTGTKRWEIVFAGIIGMYLLKNTYGKIPKSLMIGASLVIFISFISVSLYKFSWAVQTSENPVKDIIFEMFGSFQSYFSGPRVVANSIEMKTIYGKYIGLTTFINDFIGSIPIISNFVDQTNRINVYFNMYHNIPNNALIIPMVGIGYSYFPIFSPIFTVICEWFVIKVDYKLETSRTIEYKYLYLYFGLYLSMCLGFNTQIIFAKFLIPFLPLLILFKINEKICLKKKVYLSDKTNKILLDSRLKYYNENV